ncbi:protein of unknown function [Streptomyces sp. KY75]|nr:protein of unknown function [Streptomyces sp. KY70]CAD5973078.1 protein of unknown function [Streptomyces sp. KY75]
MSVHEQVPTRISPIPPAFPEGAGGLVESSENPLAYAWGMFRSSGARPLKCAPLRTHVHPGGREWRGDLSYRCASACRDPADRDRPRRHPAA